jgi:hypothetical protein
LVETGEVKKSHARDEGGVVVVEAGSDGGTPIVADYDHFGHDFGGAYLLQVVTHDIELVGG